MSEHTRKSFSDLGISPWLIDTLKALAIYEPTDIQEGVIAQILEGMLTKINKVKLSVKCA